MVLQFIFGNRNSISHGGKSTKLGFNCCLTRLVNETFLSFLFSLQNNHAVGTAKVDVNGGGVTKRHSRVKFQCRHVGGLKQQLVFNYCQCQRNMWYASRYLLAHKHTPILWLLSAVACDLIDVWE